MISYTAALPAVTSRGARGKQTFIVISAFKIGCAHYLHDWLPLPHRYHPTQEHALQNDDRGK